MKYFIFVFFVFLVSCQGTEGRIVFYEFNYSKYEIEKALLSLQKTDSILISKRNIDIKEGFYFDEISVSINPHPQEKYLLRFTGDSTEWNQTAFCRLALLAKFDGEVWRFRSDLNSQEKLRMQKLFEEKVLSRIGYTYFKNN